MVYIIKTYCYFCVRAIYFSSPILIFGFETVPTVWYLLVFILCQYVNHSIFNTCCIYVNHSIFNTCCIYVNHSIFNICCIYVNHSIFNTCCTGADPGFKVRGAHLKKLRRVEGGAKNLGVFCVKNHDFTSKKSYFFQF
jgi:hypothetical protein